MLYVEKLRTNQNRPLAHYVKFKLYLKNKNLRVKISFIIRLVIVKHFTLYNKQNFYEFLILLYKNSS